MASNVRELIDSVEEDELYKLQSDLAKGGRHLKKLVNEKIEEIQNSKTNFCITCGKGLADDDSCFSLTFGKEGLRKRGSFCEIDCLEYFISELKKLREKNMTKGAGKYELQGNNKDL